MTGLVFYQDFVLQDQFPTRTSSLCLLGLLDSLICIPCKPHRKRCDSAIYPCICIRLLNSDHCQLASVVFFRRKIPCLRYASIFLTSGIRALEIRSTRRGRFSFCNPCHRCNFSDRRVDLISDGGSYVVVSLIQSARQRWSLSVRRQCRAQINQV